MPLPSYGLIVNLVVSIAIAVVVYYHLLYPRECNNEEKGKETKYVSAKIEDFHSSVWCWGANHTNRRCRFTNLCYRPQTKDFVFFHGPKSALQGIPEDRFNPALLDLSSVEDHNTQYFSYTEIPAKSAKNFKIELVDGAAVVFNRFKPDNLMHVLHDDLLPLFFTLQEVCGANDIASSWCAKTIQLVFSDDSPACQYYSLYGLFSSRKPVLLSEKKTDLLFCLSDSYVGLSKYTLWYQYGFRKPQGPLPAKNLKFVGREVIKFVNFLKQKLDVKPILPTCIDCVGLAVLLSRTDTRLILNEDKLVSAIVQISNLKVEVLRLEEHSIKDVISAISRAQLMIGVHGAMLVLSMFLPPGATVIELFPYAIDPAHYTPYKTLASLPDLGLMYYSWQNVYQNNTFTHPNYPPELGGIDHLTSEEQERIIASTKVPPHLCCDDPEWMFRIYQDTVVDIESFSSVLTKALRQNAKSKANLNSFNSLSIDLFPSEVRDLHCERIGNSIVRIEWKQPWNVQYIEPQSIEYELWVQFNDDDVRAFIVKETRYEMQNASANAEYLVWIRCCIDQKNGPFNVYPLYCSS